MRTPDMKQASSLRSIYVRSDGVLWGLIFFPLLLVGCEAEPAITQYKVAKELPKKIPSPDSVSGAFSFDLPSGWRETKPRGGFAAKSFAVADGEVVPEVTVTPLQGSAGGQTANANRWRGQLGLSALSEEQMKAEAKAVEVAGGRGFLFDFSSTDTPARRIVGVVREEGPQTWFIKLTGEASAVDQALSGYVSFVKSIRFATHNGIEQEHAKDVSKTVAPASAGSSDFRFDLPSAWHETKPRGGFAAKSFATSEGNSAAEVTVTPLLGAAGGQTANANRWRGQLGLSPLSDEQLKAEAKSVEVAGGRGVLFDFSSTEAQARRIVGVVREEGPQTWFIKMSGDAPAVEAALSDFITFVKSIRFASEKGNRP